MTTFETHTVRGDFIPLDLLIWRRFKRQMPGLLERTIAINPGIADAGPFLPIGAVITIPIDAPATEPPLRDVIRLWD